MTDRDDRVVIGAERRSTLRMLEARRPEVRYLKPEVDWLVRELYARAEAEGLTFEDDDVRVTLRVEVLGRRAEPPEIDLDEVE